MDIVALRSCAFTDHRHKKFPWGYHEEDIRYIALKKKLLEQITSLISVGYTDFLSGMAEGTDIWAAQAVLTLKKDYPELGLHCILPCEGQAARWSASSQKLYFSILG